MVRDRSPIPPLSLSRTITFRWDTPLIWSGLLGHYGKDVCKRGSNVNDFIQRFSILGGKRLLGATFMDLHETKTRLILRHLSLIL